MDTWICIDRVPLLSTGNYHNIVNRLFSDIKQKVKRVKRKKERSSVTLHQVTKKYRISRITNSQLHPLICLFLHFKKKKSKIRENLLKRQEISP